MDASSGGHEAVTAPARVGGFADARRPRRRLLGVPLAVAALVLGLLTPQPHPLPPEVRPAIAPVSKAGGEASVDSNQLDARALPGVGPRYAQRIGSCSVPIRRPQTLIDQGLPIDVVESLSPRLRFAP